eukprot:112701-Amphidinium_carterae.1
MALWQVLQGDGHLRSLSKFELLYPSAQDYEAVCAAILSTEFEASQHNNAMYRVQCQVPRLSLSESSSDIDGVDIKDLSDGGLLQSTAMRLVGFGNAFKDERSGMHRA